MRSFLNVFFLLLITTSIAVAQSDSKASSEELQKWINLEKEETRAKYGESVLIVIIKVKDESKIDFDKWIEEVLYKALYNSESDMKKAQLKATRWLEPTRQNQDGTWTYSWIMDPIIPNTNYDIELFLVKEYGEEIGKAHWQKYLTFMADQPQSHMLKQTNY